MSRSTRGPLPQRPRDDEAGRAGGERRVQSSRPGCTRTRQGEGEARRRTGEAEAGAGEDRGVPGGGRQPATTTAAASAAACTTATATAATERRRSTASATASRRGHADGLRERSLPRQLPPQRQRRARRPRPRHHGGSPSCPAFNPTKCPAYSSLNFVTGYKYLELRHHGGERHRRPLGLVAEGPGASAVHLVDPVRPARRSATSGTAGNAVLGRREHDRGQRAQARLHEPRHERQGRVHHRPQGPVEPGARRLPEDAAGPHDDLHQRLPLPLVGRRRAVGLRRRLHRQELAGLGDRHPRSAASVHVHDGRAGERAAHGRDDRLDPQRRRRLQRRRLGVGKRRRPRLLDVGPALQPGDGRHRLGDAVRAAALRGRPDHRQHGLVHAQRLPLPERARTARLPAT